MKHFQEQYVFRDGSSSGGPKDERPSHSVFSQLVLITKRQDKSTLNDQRNASCFYAVAFFSFQIGCKLIGTAAGCDVARFVYGLLHYLYEMSRKMMRLTLSAFPYSVLAEVLARPLFLLRSIRENGSTWGRPILSDFTQQGPSALCRLLFTSSL
jgi:hypothetical protein